MKTGNMLDKVRLLLQTSNLAKVAKKSGVNYYTVRAIRMGQEKSPNFFDVQKLAEFFGVDK